MERLIHVEAWSRDGGWRRPEVRIVIRHKDGRFAGTNRLARTVVGKETASRLGLR